MKIPTMETRISYFMSFLLWKSTTIIYSLGDPAAMAMNWMDVDGDKLMEPVVSFVSSHTLEDELMSYPEIM